METGICEVVGRMRGGVAEVLAVHDLQHDRLGIAWVLPEESGAEFLAEALVGLEHIAIARHLGLTQADGRLALLSEPLPVRTLKDHLDEHGPLPHAMVIQLALRLADGLSRVHAAGLVHGAISPETVHLEGHEVVLADFREARFDPDPGPDLAALVATVEAALGGKVAPELAELLARARGEGESPITAASELAAALLGAADKLVPGDTWPSMPPTSRPLALTESLEREGDVVGSFHLDRLLGEGAMGRVFAARHSRLGRQVALKILRPEHARTREIVQRFFQEARTVNEISHENIVQISDFVEETLPDGRVRAYCVMELLEGQSLTQVVQSGPLPLARVLDIGRQLCRALGAAHRVGVVHRDVKPDNIFVATREGRDFVKVVDFGVAKLMRPMGELPTGTTVDGAIIGTPSYMSPEQAQGLEVDFRSDLHAVGVLLFELIAGQLPFTATRFGALAAQIISQPPPQLPTQTACGELVPLALNELVMQLLAKDPRARPPSMEAVELSLSAIDPAEGHRRPRGYLAAVALAAAVAGVVLVGHASREPRDAAPLSLPNAPMRTVPPPPPPRVEPPRAAPPPAHEVVKSLRQVQLHVASTPPGAKVVRGDTGEALGLTPLVHAFEPGAAALPLRIELTGYQPVDREIALDRDAQLDVTLAATPHGARHVAVQPRRVIDPFSQ